MNALSINEPKNENRNIIEKIHFKIKIIFESK